MASTAIVTDSACDLTPSTAEERHIAVVPLMIRFGDEELVDRDELSTKEFWDRVVTGPDMPSTAAPAPGLFQKAFADAADAGRDGVVCITLSSKLSATYQAACAAAEAFGDRIPVRVIDSLSVTLGQGLLALSACDMAADGAGVDDIAAAIDEAKLRTQVYGVLGSLDYLKKGGRIGGAAHLVGSLLSIKPVIEVRDGAVDVESRQRTRTRAVQYMAQKVKDAGPLDRLAVANGAAADIDGIVSMLSGADTAHELVVGDLGPVVGAHAGPGTVGVCFTTAS